MISLSHGKEREKKKKKKKNQEVETDEAVAIDSAIDTVYAQKG